MRSFGSVLFGSMAMSVVAHAESPPPDVVVGHVGYFDIATKDLKRAEAFYAKLFSWRYEPVKGTDLAVEIFVGTTRIGALRVAEGPVSATNGVVYVEVADMRASCKAAQALGGTVPTGFPFELSEHRGSIAIVVDPTGAPIGMHSRAGLTPAK